MVGKQKFGEHFARALDFFSLRLDFHSSFDLTNTGRLRHTRAFDLHRTHPTNRDRVESRVMTKNGDVDSQFACSIPNCCACGNSYRLAVDCQGDCCCFLRGASSWIVASSFASHVLRITDHVVRLTWCVSA